MSGKQRPIDQESVKLWRELMEIECQEIIDIMDRLNKPECCDSIRRVMQAHSFQRLFLHVTVSGRHVQLEFNYCPKCGRRL